MMTTLHVVMAGGGTAGHISPMIAMARALERAGDVEITMVGTASGMETDLVPAAGYQLVTIDRVPMPRRPNLDLARLPWRLRTAIRQAQDILRAANADVVVGVGGYVSTPVYLAARRMGIPVVVHEANVRAGLANRIGARRAAAVGTAFARTRLPGAQHVGMPMRTQISQLDRSPAARAEARSALGLDPERTTLLVTGGSSGALAVNRAITGALSELLEHAQILHLTGRGKTVLNDDGEPLTAPGYHQREYVDGLEQVYAAADLVIARAGAGTVCEIAAAGLASILVPLPIGNGEQAHNAQDLVQAGAAIMVDDAAFTASWVRDHLPAVLGDPARVDKMAQAAHALGIRNADDTMAQLIKDAATTRGGQHG